MEKSIPSSLRGAVRKIDRRRQKEVLAAPDAIVERKAARVANYEGAKAQVGKWEGAVMKNRLADHLVFPILPTQRITMPESNEERRHRGNRLVKDALERAQKGSTDLDAKIFAKIFPGEAGEKFLEKAAAVAAESDEEFDPSDKVSLQERLAELRLLKVKHGQMTAKMRQRAKIRSKNFHRHLKRQKVAQEANALKALSSADPDAFKEKLEALQKRRIEERMTQRHRQGGRWARQTAALQKSGAGKSDLDAMQQIAQQLLQKEKLDDPQEEDDDGGWITVTRSNASNSGVEAAWNAQRGSADLPAAMSRFPARRTAYSAPRDVQNEEMEQEEEEEEEILQMETTRRVTVEDFEKMEEEDAPVRGARTKEKPKVTATAARKPTAVITLGGQLPSFSKTGCSDPVALDPESNLEAELQGDVGDQEELEADFAAEKAAQEEEEQPKDLDTFLPGWNTWTGPGTDVEKEAKKRERFLHRAPKINRRDAHSRRLVISERRLSRSYRQHQMREVPFPFPDAESWEKAMERPIGRLWTTEASHKALIRPRVVAKMGQVIAPLSGSHLVRRGQTGKTPKRLQGQKDVPKRTDRKGRRCSAMRSKRS